VAKVRSASTWPACLASGGGLLRGFLEREIEQDIDLARGQFGGIELAQSAEERERLGSGGEGVVHVAGVKAFFSHAPHNGKRTAGL